MTLFWAIAVATLFQVCRSQNPDPRQFDFMYKCRYLADGSWEMQAYINPYDNIVDEIFAVNLATGTSVGESCSSVATQASPIQEIKKSGNTYNLKVSIIPGVSITPQCGAWIGLVPSQYLWQFEVTTDYPHPALRLAYEKRYNVRCDFNNASYTEQGFVNASIVITKNVNVPTAAPLPGEISKLSVVLSDSLTVLTTLSNTDKVRLKAELLPGTHGYTGVSPYNCKACSSAECNNSISLTVETGCLSNGGGGLLGGQPFTNAIGGNTQGAILYTGEFEPFTFSSGGDLYITCDFEYCNATTGSSKCVDRCATLGQGGRKRRDVQGIKGGNSPTPKLEPHVAVLVKVVSNVVHSDSIPVIGEFHKSQPVRETLGTCNGFHGFLIAVCVLGACLLLALALCLCICVKLFSYHGVSEKSETKDKSNVAFR